MLPIRNSQKIEQNIVIDDQTKKLVIKTKTKLANKKKKVVIMMEKKKQMPLKKRD